MITDVDEKQRFYYNGLFYKDEKSFIEAVSHYANSEISPVSAERILNASVEHILMNIFVKDENGPHLSNADFAGLCETFWTDFVQKYAEKRQEQQK